MRHITISNYGSFLGLSGARLVIREQDHIIREVALSRLRSISIAKKGISLSSDLVQACAYRGIRIFFLDWRARNVSALIGMNQHAVVALRKQQFAFVQSPHLPRTVAELISSKIINQRAVLLYFAKMLKSSVPQRSFTLRRTAEHLDVIIQDLKNTLPENHWRARLLGAEGSAAKLYWDALSHTQLFSASFSNRQGRGATEITNQLLNYGYTILQSYVWSALDNAGLEVYCGFYHTDRPGKPSLVLDTMEEYRAWVVDRNVIKLRHGLSKDDQLSPALKKRLTDEIHQTMATIYPYRGKKLRLESILQRQVYRLCSTIVDQKHYRGFHFKW